MFYEEEEYKLPEPVSLMSAKAYKTKIVSLRKNPPGVGAPNGKKMTTHKMKQKQVATL